MARDRPGRPLRERDERLLGQVESDRLLCAVNSYLLRQPSDEAFATAVHLSLDLQTGRFSIGNAGHPAPVQFVAGSGRWSVLTSAGGPALGLIVGAQFNTALLEYYPPLAKHQKHDPAAIRAVAAEPAAGTAIS